ncbi:hypothetical protein IW261DRAFT_1016774 [Armillaria novae-zelandiae]|uniref:Uncharacterized protein n=1 Tax=Armillaria novae-zelandiae TaxID=153914 RepID=A0AA39NN76_9AGAR|nr:hypothetical protein IW261DRAFT_1016774 [Armillaria novae-zelandiae]
MTALYSELRDLGLIIDRLADNVPVLTACSLVARVFLPRCQNHHFRHIRFYLSDYQCAGFFADKCPLVEELPSFKFGNGDYVGLERIPSEPRPCHPHTRYQLDPFSYGLRLTGVYRPVRGSEGLVPKKNKMDTADTVICALTYSRRMLDMCTRLQKAVQLYGR